MIKLVSIDMDGTLLNSKSEVSDKNAEMIKEFQNRGGKIVINTGRSFANASKYLEKAGIYCDYICLSGACIHDAKGNCLQKDTLSREDILRIIELQKRYKIYISYSTSVGSLSSSSRDFAKEHLMMESYYIAKKMGKKITDKEAEKRFINTLEYVQYDQNIEEHLNAGVDFYKLIILCMDEDVLESLKNELSTWSQLTVSSSFGMNIEVNTSRVDKGRALLEYAIQNDISMEEIMIIGDSENDESMFNIPFKMRVAVENATRKIMEMSTNITKSNDNDGVAYAIEKLLLSE